MTTEWFVSLEGDDNWSGKLDAPNEARTDGPLATIAAAQQAVRACKEQACLTGPATVWIRGGHYRLAQPLVFTSEDSAPVTYAAYPGERPVIDGSKVIAGWKEELVGGIPMWVADVPELATGKWQFRQLFVNGQRRSRTRLPKQGFHVMKNVPTIDFHNKGLTNDLFDGTDTFICEQGHIQKWKNLQDVEVVAIHFWIEERMPIASFDESTGTVRSSRRSMFVLKDDVAKRYAKYYVENVFEALSDHGEWYADRSAGKVYYIPHPDERLDNTEITAGVAAQLLLIAGDPDKQQYVEYLRFKGLQFSHTDWHQPAGGGERFERPGIDYAAAPQAAFNIPGVIRMEGARYCAIEDCRIEQIGWYGIELSDGCMSNRIVGNTIGGMGAGGIKLDGADSAGERLRRTGGNRVTDNHISHGGLVFHSAVGILSVHSFGNTIAHNHIHDLFYTGISCGWVWGYADNISQNNMIAYNHIHDLGHGMLSDMGGIYTLGVQPGTVIRGNLIHHIEKNNYGGWAIYPDEGSSHILIENNVCYHTSSQVFHQHYGRENVVRNNIFAFGIEGQASLSRVEAHNSFTFERNIVISNGQPLFVGGYAGELEKRGMSSDLNLFWDYSAGQLVSGKQKFDEEANFSLIDPLTIEELQQLGYDRHSLFQDPLFADPEHGDYTLHAESPAFQIGFKPIDVAKVGPRSAEKRD